MLVRGTPPRRKQLRLPGCDYSEAGAYFVTICVHQRRHLLARIDNGTRELTPAGDMVEHWGCRIADRFPGTLLDQSIVMPNHFHAIVWLTAASREKGTTLGHVVGWFKAMSTNAYLRGVREDGWPPLRRRLWQRGFFEHIVRDDRGLRSIRAYIAENPLAWDADPENPDGRNCARREAWQR